MSLLCPVCHNDHSHLFFSLRSTPTQDGLMAETKEEAINTMKGDVLLHYCHHCNYIWNEGHTPDKIQFDQYDFSLDHSPTYKAYQENLTSDLIDRYKLNGKTIVEVGCGQGDFLKLLCRKGNNRGIGIDPGFDPAMTHLDKSSNCTFLREYYSYDHAELRPDLIVCRLVIDLITYPFVLLEIICRNVQKYPNTMIYFEIFDAEYTFRNKVIWNIVYEHRSWLTRYSIPYFFESRQFEVISLDKGWHGEYYGVVLKPGEGRPEAKPSAELLQITNDFKVHADEVLSRTEIRLKNLQEKGVRMMGWGAGARAVSFFNIFETDFIKYIVDINPLRQGKYLPGGGQEIVAPTFVQEYKPELIIITNPSFANEIKESLAVMGLKPDFWVL